MSSTPFKTLLDKALAETTQKLIKFPNYGVYIHALEQLNFIQSIINQSMSPTQKEKDKINIGLMAVKELEATDIEYCDLLCEVDYYFKRL
jgi:hypothetical protein